MIRFVDAGSKAKGDTRGDTRAETKPSAPRDVSSMDQGSPPPDAPTSIKPEATRSTKASARKRGKAA